MSPRCFERLRAVPDARGRLIMFHYAGASAFVFRPWLELLPAALDVVALQLPGRDGRMREPLHRSVAEVVREAAENIVPWLDRPVVFYGHSIGALIAFELVRELRARELRLPEHLVVTGRRAPHLPPPVHVMHTLPDDDFVARLQHYEGTPEAILREPELMRFFLPRLRADFAISETYRFADGPLFSYPITAMGGDSDVEASLETVYQWRYQTTGAFQFHRLSGGHFFISSEKDTVLRIVRGVIERSLGL